jgi:uncharacterized damage-inducible protein DinB
MEIRTDFGRLLAYDHWANGEALSSLEALRDTPAKAVILLGHLMGAEVCWLDRMTAGRDPEDWERWETADLPTLRRCWREELPPRWASFLADSSMSDPARSFTYVNYVGKTNEFRRVGDAVLGLMFHAAYHRGQVATAVRGAGGEPAVTDFIHAARTGVIP